MGDWTAQKAAQELHQLKKQLDVYSQSCAPELGYRSLWDLFMVAIVQDYVFDSDIEGKDEDIETILTTLIEDRFDPMPGHVDYLWDEIQQDVYNRMEKLGFPIHEED